MFLPEPPESDGALRLYQDDLDDDGYVGNLTRLWAWRPEIADGFRQLRRS